MSVYKFKRRWKCYTHLKKHHIFQKKKNKKQKYGLWLKIHLFPFWIKTYKKKIEKITPFLFVRNMKESNAIYTQNSPLARFIFRFWFEYASNRRVYLNNQQQWSKSMAVYVRTIITYCDLMHRWKYLKKYPK